MKKEKIRWGILSTARIGVDKVIPALRAGKYSEIKALASRDIRKARTVAKRFSIPTFYGSYEALLKDPEVDAIYNPLPNHLHVPWTEKAVLAGKHVLCEKPIAPTLKETLHLLDTVKKYPHIRVMEAFMYRFHPQWDQVRQMIAKGMIGKIRTVISSFTYFNDDVEDYRNYREYGGGSILDIGCYSISSARYLFDEEPVEVFGILETDPVFQVDRMASAVMKFEQGTSLFTSSTLMFEDQYLLVTGTTGQIKLPLPFNPLPDKPATIYYKYEKGEKIFKTTAVDQYMLMTDAFSLALLENKPVPTPLDDALHNMRVIEAIFKSAGKRPVTLQEIT
ncbi:MAG: Gfo/Idh/MocA family oxidoreductase [Bacteroidales bacterium]|nr:Gfo/Idh/MocA family oxidoreductase [Bacteroidales bacterium]